MGATKLEKGLALAALIAGGRSAPAPALGGYLAERWRGAAVPIERGRASLRELTEALRPGAPTRAALLALSPRMQVLLPGGERKSQQLLPSRPIDRGVLRAVARIAAHVESSANETDRAMLEALEWRA